MSTEDTTKLLKAYLDASAERDALQAQLDSMTIEWGTLYEASAEEEWIDPAENKAHARSLVSLSPTDTSLRKRRVGPWVEVSE